MTHSITNSEIYKLAASKLTVQGVDIPCINGVLAFADALIELAQQVKPLEFAPDENCDYGYDLVAHASYGHYGIMKINISGNIRMWVNGDSISEAFQSAQHAIDVAQETHKGTILKALVASNA